MRRRINWPMPDPASAGRSTQCPAAGTRRCCARPCAGPQDMEMTGLRAANVWQTPDLVHSAETGRVPGAAVGVIGPVLALS